jgi:F-type H+-transporting ATPase subunit b
MEKLGINLGFFLFQVFNFTVLAILLYAWAYKPIVEMLENRKKKVAQTEEDARVAEQARANAEKEAEKIIAEARAEAGNVIREANERALGVAKDVEAAAQVKAAGAKEKALADVEAQRNQMLGDLRGQVAALAIAGAQKLVGDALDEKRQHALLSDFFAGVKGGKVAVLESTEFKGDAAEVTSALPLTDAEQETVKKDVLAKSGAQAVTFRVDPAILGGLVIKVDDKVVDGSVAGKLEGLRQSMR